MLQNPCKTLGFKKNMVYKSISSQWPIMLINVKQQIVGILSFMSMIHFSSGSVPVSLRKPKAACHIPGLGGRGQTPSPSVCIRACYIIVMQKKEV